MNKYLSHFNKIITHKREVFRASVKLGIPMQGLLHDMSKFSPIEFWESCKFYVGTSSPIDEAKKAQGVSHAWMHHKGRNSHHWEYWVDWQKSDKPIGRQIPFHKCLEMMCDYIGAGKAYEGSAWTKMSPLKRWLKCRDNYVINEQTRILMTILFKAYSRDTINQKMLSRLKERYNRQRLTSIVLFYGSLNPITTGHTKLLGNAMKATRCSLGAIEVVSNAYFKPGLIDWQHRYNMAKIAVKDNDSIIVGNLAKRDRHVKFYEICKMYQHNYDLVYTLMGDDNIDAMNKYFPDKTQMLDKFFDEFIQVVGLRNYESETKALDGNDYIKKWEGCMLYIPFTSQASSTIARKQIQEYGNTYFNILESDVQSYALEGGFYAK